jgi:biopolymer transport protein ExbD
VEGASLDDAALATALKARVASDASVRVVFTVDKAVAHKRVVALMTIAKQAGVKAMTLAAPIATTVVEKAPPAPDATPALVLSIDKAGKMFLGSRAVAEADLAAEFQKLAKAGRKKLAIAADGNVTYGTIAKVLEHAKAAGLEVGFMTQ